MTASSISSSVLLPDFLGEESCAQNLVSLKANQSWKSFSHSITHPRKVYFGFDKIRQLHSANQNCITITHHSRRYEARKEINITEQKFYLKDKLAIDTYIYREKCVQIIKSESLIYWLVLSFPSRILLDSVRPLFMVWIDFRLKQNFFDHLIS